MKPKEGLGMKILKSILNYIPLATFIINFCYFHDWSTD